MLEPNGELLPIKSNNGQKYWLYQVLTIIDALDKKRSVCDWFSNSAGPPVVAASIDYFVIDNEQLSGVSIFQFRAWPAHTVVTEAFVDRTQRAGLNGFDFAKIWPYPRGVDWNSEAAELRRRRRKKSDPEKQTLVVILSLSGEQPNAREKQHIKRLEDELDALLGTPTLKSTYFGTYSGTDITEGEYRMFVTCPNVDKLCDKMLDYLQNLHWPGKACAIKRYGRMYDAKAKEAIVDIPAD